MKAFEATVGKGTKVHAVVLSTLPPYKERQDTVVTTVCKQRVRGSSVYATLFGRRDTPYEMCAMCSKGVGGQLVSMDRAQRAKEEPVPSLEARMEQVLTQLDRAQAQGFSAQERVVTNLKINGGREHRVESFVTIKGKRYRLMLEEV